MPARKYLGPLPSPFGDHVNGKMADTAQTRRCQLHNQYHLQCDELSVGDWPGFQMQMILTGR